jgi:hypothetical protein
VTDHLVLDRFISGNKEHDVHAAAGFVVISELAPARNLCAATGALE